MSSPPYYDGAEVENQDEWYGGGDDFFNWDDFSYDAAGSSGGYTDESFVYDEASGTWYDTLTGDSFAGDAPADYFDFGGTDESFIYDEETGTWFDTMTGEYFDADGFAQGWNYDNGTDASFIYDPSTGLYFDTLTGAYLDSEGNESFGDLFADADSTLTPRTDYWNETPQFIQPTNVSAGGGFFSGLANIFGNIFGGPPGAGNAGGTTSPGGGSSSSSTKPQQQQQAAQQQTQQQQQAIRQLQEQLAAARRDASTPSAAVASLQNQIRNLQAAAAGGSPFSGMNTSTLLAVAAVGAVVYVATRPRRVPSAA